MQEPLELDDQMREALVILMEECGEVIQRASKILRYNLSYSNIDALNQEAGDLMEMIYILQDLRLLDEEKMYGYAMAKRDKLMIWSTLFDDTKKE